MKYKNMSKKLDENVENYQIKKIQEVLFYNGILRVENFNHNY
jgi:hypothetical protein